MSAVSRVIDHIGSGPLLASMVRAVDGSVWTDLPITVPAALQLMDLLDGAQVSRYRSVVFGPRKWAYQDAQTPVYTYKLRVDLVRQWIDQRFRPVS